MLTVERSVSVEKEASGIPAGIPTGAGYACSRRKSYLGQPGSTPERLITKLFRRGAEKLQLDFWIFQEEAMNVSITMPDRKKAINLCGLGSKSGTPEDGLRIDLMRTI
jgi:hypothetical protein